MLPISFTPSVKVLERKGINRSQVVPGLVDVKSFIEFAKEFLDLDRNSNLGDNYSLNRFGSSDGSKCLGLNFPDSTRCYINMEYDGSISIKEGQPWDAYHFLVCFIPKEDPTARELRALFT